MHLIIEEILKNGFSLTIGYNKPDERYEYILDGFYKSGTIKFIEKGDSLEAIARYDEVTEINSFNDIVSLNYEWWDRSKDRCDGWKSPDSKWLPFLIKRGLVKEEVKIVKSYS